MSSFSRQEQFVHSRQQTSRTATPKVTRMANTLAYEANQCNKLCIIQRGPRPHQTPLLEDRQRQKGSKQTALRQAKSTTYPIL
jgi:hypothetical protein